MASTKRGVMIASISLMVAVLLSACDLSYSQPPAVTNTPIDANNLFSTVLPTTENNNAQIFASQTAFAAGTFGPATETPAGVTPQSNVTATSTPLVALNPTATPTATLAVSSGVTSGPTATLIPSGSRPATYTLQSGEFPFCIARRFNVDPDELLAANGIISGDIYYAGMVLKIPQTGNPWPGDRKLSGHPTTYTVGSSDETIYGVACKFGDVDPSAIAQANGISVGAALTAGQQLSIP